MLIENAHIYTNVPGQKIFKGCISIDDEGVIQYVGPHDPSREDRSGEVLDADGRLCLPGLICSHGHFYGELARGMPMPNYRPVSFRQILEGLWWRLDALLDRESVGASAQVGILEAITSGTTTILDHHASYGFISESLDVVAQEMARAGVRGNLSFEVSDRHGLRLAKEAISENVRFAQSLRPGGLITASFGLHASFTLSDETLTKSVEAAKKWTLPVHVHVAEGVEDQAAALGECGYRVVHRLEEAGALETGGRPLLVHGVHIDGDELRRVAATSVLIHCPHSNMNNGVGLSPVTRLLRAGGSAALGTDGITYDMFAEAKGAYFAHKLARGESQAMPGDMVTGMLWDGGAVAAGQFYRAAPGRLAEGRAGDLILLEYRPPTALTAENLPSHLIFGMRSRDVTHTVVSGRLLMDERRVLTMDPEKVAERARKAADRLHRLWLERG